MCGFAGLLRWDGLRAGDTEKVRSAARLLAHRGPDGDGFFNDDHIALGFRRLKIIDLSPAGDQPMSNEDGRLRIVFNGEIYNFRELREQLLAGGHVFKSQSDTEVLLHLYEQHGEEMLPKLRGMFAFAIWNSAERRLFMARDPLGVKPLYFAERAGLIAFASEAKALFPLGIAPEPDLVAIHEALTFRYVPAPRSGFKDVEKLPPGNLAIAEKGTLQYRKWWANAAARSENSMATDMLSLAAKRRLVSDVPLGAWLSGGIDSGLVVSSMPQGTRTFCAGFNSPEYDERDLAKLSAQHLHAQHTDFDVPADVFNLLPQIVWHADEPFFDSSCLPTYVLAQKTKPFVTVVLSGDGGDESFCGYDRYVGMQMLARYKKVPGFLRKLMLGYAKWRHPVASRQGWDRMLRWLEKCRLLEAAGRHPYVAAMELFSDEQKSALYGDEMLEATDGAQAREYLENALARAREACGHTTEKPIDNTLPGILQRADLETYLPGDVLHKVDRMSMAHGVEVRSPFLDVDLVGWAVALPDSVKLPSRETKPLLRGAARALLPDSVVNARKRGFGVPLDDWFRGPLQKTALALFEDSHLAAEGVFKPKFWVPLWQEHQNQQAQHGERLYALLALELWYRTFIENAAAERPQPMTPG